MIIIGNENSKSKLTNVREGDVQQNAVDVRLDTVYQLTGMCKLTESAKEHRSTFEKTVNANNQFELIPGQYNVTLENEIDVAEGEAGWLIPRSTLIRNGIQLLTGLYDSGYKGKMVTCLIVPEHTMFYVERGARIAQFITFKAECKSLYNGDYQGK